MRTNTRRVAGAAWLVLLGAIWAAAQQPPAAPPAPAKAEEQAAIQKIYQTVAPGERLALAEEFLTKYTESPLRSRAYAAAAEVYRMRNDFAKAVEYGERAIEFSPRDAFSMILVADALAEGPADPAQPVQDRLVKAEEYARRALQILPELFAAAPRRPDVPEEEFNKQRQYIEAQPHATLGYIYLRRNQYDQAEAEFIQAVQLNQWRPNVADYQRLGVVQMRLKKYPESATAFQRCAELNRAALEQCQKDCGEGTAPDVEGCRQRCLQAYGPALETSQKWFEGVQRLIKAQEAAKPPETPKPEKPQE